MSTTLLVDPTRGFRVWNIDDIYLGPDVIPTGVSVPNVNDMVLDWTRGFFRVIAVDDTDINPTYTPVLSEFDVTLLNNPNAGDILGRGLTGYQPAAHERAFFDNSVVPHTISIDDRYRVYGADAINAKLFKGTDVTSNGTVISLTFNGSGNITGENIALELIDPTNPAIKRPIVIFTNTALNEGELVTLVIYTQEGGAIGEHTFIVKSGTAIRGIEASTISIIDIELVTDLLDDVELDLVKVPANVPITGGDFQARLLYSNGATSLIPIDGTKARIFGLDNFNTAIAGSISDIVLTYFPDTNEPLINSENPELRSISSVYRIQTVTNSLDASFKIYIEVLWNNVSGLYENTYFLTNLKHDILVKLTPSQITIESATAVPISYAPNQGVQELVLSILMSDVFASGFAGYTFIQQTKIEYAGNAEGDNPWLIDYLNNQTNVFGSLVKFGYSTAGAFPLDLTAGEPTLADWLNKLYFSIHPTYDPVLEELVDVTPTHFRLQYGVFTSGDFPIGDWQVLHNNLGGTVWVEDETVTIIWLLDTPSSVDHLILALTPIMIHNTLV